MNPVDLWGRLSDRDRRAIALGAAVVLPALLWVYGVSPYLGAVEQRRSRIEARRSLLDAERDLLAARKRYPRQVEAAATRLREMAPALLDSRSRGVATAELTQYVEDRAAASRVRLTATQPRAVRRVDRRLLAIPLTVEGESDLQGVLAFLEALEHGPKLLRVGDLRIRRRSGAGRLEDKGMEVLALRVSVTGYVLHPEGRGTDAAAGRGVASGSSPGGRSTGPDLAERTGASP